MAQHDHGGHSQYADEKRSHIPSLTMAEYDELLSGGGMGFAKPAELNRYPGPKHVLELADSLGLSSEQREQVERIRAKMAGRAVELGREYVHSEHELNRLFADGNATEQAVVEQTARVGDIRSALRSTHLIAHVETAAVLTKEQIETYHRLRGY